MRESRITAVDVVEQAIDEYRQEIKRIEGEILRLQQALDMLLGKAPETSPKLKQPVETPPNGKRLSYPWTKLINEAFDEHGQLSLTDLRRVLNEKGFPAFKKEYSAAIQALVARQLGKTIERVGERGSGVYRRIGLKEQMNLEDEVKVDIERGQ